MGPYRSDEAALRERLSGLESALGEIEAQQRAAAALDPEKVALEREKADVERRLSQLRSADSLEGLRIASPCRASWEDMVGDDRSRFCGDCKKHVYNFSGMTRAEAVSLVRDRTTDICVRMFQRSDGTVLTADCPVGARKKTVRRLAVVSATGLGLAAAGFGMFATTSTTGSIPVQQMGQMPALEPSAVPSSAPSATPSAAPEASAKPAPHPRPPMMGKPSFHRYDQ